MYVFSNSFITLLIRLLMEASSTVNSQGQFSQFASAVVTDIVVPNCVWKGGRSDSYYYNNGPSF